MELQDFYQLIGLQPEIVEILRGVETELDLEEVEPCLAGLMEGRTAPSAYRKLNQLLSEDKDHMSLLYCYLECARRAYAGYQERHIPDQIYVDTMKCFPRFLAECERETGRMYFNRGWWVYRQTSMRIFRLGMLEYEYSDHEGEPALALHIPTDARLNREDVDRSLEQAELFFQTYVPDFQFNRYTCNSWLLSPQLRPFLAQGSNILAFQDRFRILREDREDREFIQWLFQRPADTPYVELPSATSLQKQVKDLLLRGGTVGCAYGVLEHTPSI